MKEQDYQKKIINKFEANGYYVINLIKTNKNGISDLLCLKKGEDAIFIEVKTDTGKLSELQKFRLSEQKKKGFKVFYTKKTELISY
tara:strand:+ start:4845 stop:5102 length:258 start_codon:yes stop_codon:yes gene_type:complete